MKLKFLLSFLLPAQLAFAQYQVELSTETYTELTGATELTYDASQGGYYHPLNFTFPTFRRTADLSLLPAVPSNGAYITPQGYLAVYEKPDYKNTIVYHCLFNQNFNLSAGMTKVSAVLEGTAPNRIAKFQWKDMIYNGDATQKVNCQAWLHENNGNISYHYGPNTLNGATSVAVYTGLIVLNENFSALVDQLSLTGTPTSKQTTSGYTALNFPPMTGIPANGSVITFKRHYVSVDEVPDQNSVILYPNPASNKLHIQLPAAKHLNVSIINTAGAEVFSCEYNMQTISIGLEQLSNGLYFVRLQSSDGIESKKLVINR